jgi:hypothetical protein
LLWFKANIFKQMKQIEDNTFFKGLLCFEAYLLKRTEPNQSKYFINSQIRAILLFSPRFA